MKGELTQERLKELLHYDPDTGVFTWLQPGKRRLVGFTAGTVNSRGYLYISIGGKQYRAHRLAWLYMTGEVPENEIDHRNGIGTDNRFANLRKATRSQNKANSATYKSNSSGCKGVGFDKATGRWKARVQVNGKRISLGYFDSPESAYAAYCEAATKFHGEFANMGEHANDNSSLPFPHRNTAGKR